MRGLHSFFLFVLRRGAETDFGLWMICQDSVEGAHRVKDKLITHAAAIIVNDRDQRTPYDYVQGRELYGRIGFADASFWRQCLRGENKEQEDRGRSRTFCEWFF